MTINVTTPVTGAPQSGFTTPAFVVTADVPPPGNPGEQVAVTGLTGTMVGVTTHSVASPFTSNITRPANPRVLGLPNPVTGAVKDVPLNTYTIVTRKGVTVLAGQPIRTMVAKTVVEVPAGADLADPANVRACLSMHFGVIAQQSSGFGDLTINAIL